MRRWLAVAMLVACGGPRTVERASPPPATSDAAVGSAITPDAGPKPPGTGPLAVVWSVLLGGNTIVAATEAVLLPDGGAVVAGTERLPKSHYPSTFLRAFDASGVPRWSLDLDVYSQPAALRALDDGSVLACGSFEGTLAQDGKTLATSTSKDRTDAFVVKVTAAGKLEWIATGGSTGTDWCYGLAVLANGSIAVTGLIGGDATFGTLAVKRNAARDVLVAVLDDKGTWTEAAQVGSAQDDTAFGLAASGDTFCITGYLGSDTTIAGKTLKMPPPPKKPVDVRTQGFVACFDGPTLTAKWAVGFGGKATYDSGQAVVVSADGDVTLVADIADHAVVARFDAMGNQRWLTTLAAGEARALAPIGSTDVLAVDYAGSGTDLVRFAPDGTEVARGRIVGEHPRPPGDVVGDDTGDDFEISDVSINARGRVLLGGRLGHNAHFDGSLFAPSQPALTTDNGWVGAAIALEPR